MAGTDPRIKSGDGHDVVGVIPGGPEGPGRGSIACRLIVDSLPLRCTPAGNDNHCLHRAHLIIADLVPVIAIYEA
jgi:hypothetical protein